MTLFLHIGGDISLDQRDIVGIFTLSPQPAAIPEGMAPPDERNSIDVSGGSPRSMVMTTGNIRYLSASTSAALARKMTRFRRRENLFVRQPEEV